MGEHGGNSPQGGKNPKRLSFPGRSFYRARRILIAGREHSSFIKLFYFACQKIQRLLRRKPNRKMPFYSGYFYGFKCHAAVFSGGYPYERRTGQIGIGGVVVEKTEYYSPSSERGRYCSFQIKCKPKSLEDPTANAYSLSIVIKDKDGNEICRYPFTYQFTNIPYSL